MDKIDSIKIIPIKCKFGMHKYEIYKEEELMDVRKYIVGKVIISRCSLCGKIHADKIRTVENY